jgi:parallel beta-helix repeat protein
MNVLTSDMIENNLTNGWGILFGPDHGSSNKFVRNHITNASRGLEVLIDRPSHTLISQNIINGGKASPRNGILVGGVGMSYCNISGNIVSNTRYGLECLPAFNSSMTGNILINNTEVGLRFNGIKGCVLRNNTMINNSRNLQISDLGYSNIDTSNTVNGRPVYYWVNKSDQTVPLDAGYVGLFNCTRIIVRGLNLTNNREGMFLAYTNSSIVTENSMENNLCGIKLYNSFNNPFYLNTFLNNTNQVWVWSGGPLINTWDMGYPMGGNYWSDYRGTDVCSGPFQNVTGSDGIGDVSYVIDANNTDHYPLMGRFRSFNGVPAVSNSTISNFQINEATISFNVTGPPGTTGFCTLTILHSTLASPYIVMIDSYPVQYTTIFENDTVSIIYFAYRHSTHEVTIIGAMSGGENRGGISYTN